MKLYIFCIRKILHVSLCIFTFFLVTGCPRVNIFPEPPKPCVNEDGLRVEVTYPNGNVSYVCSNSVVDFDTAMPAADRMKTVTFTLTNTTTDKPVVFKDKGQFITLVPVDPGEYTLHTDYTDTDSPNIVGLMPGESIKFYSEFLSTKCDNSPKSAKITMKYNDDKEYSFDLTCTSRTIVKDEFTEPSSSPITWIVPDYLMTSEISATVTLVAGGGAGGNSCKNYLFEFGAGGGGGAGEFIISENIILKKGSVYSIVVGNGGIGIDGSDSTFSENTISDEGKLNLTAIGGKRGNNGWDHDCGVGGKGAPDGAPGRYGDGTAYGGNGGNNGRGYGGGGGYGSGGGSAPKNSGGGGGGGSVRLGFDLGSLPGGNGGSGYVSIEWIGFSKP